MDYIALAVKSHPDSAETAPDGHARRLDNWDNRQSLRQWHEGEQDDSPWARLRPALERAIVDGVFDKKDSKKPALLRLLAKRVARGEAFSDAALGVELDISKERVGQMFAEIGLKLIELGYVDPGELRQNGILLSKKLRKLHDPAMAKE